MAKKFTDYVKEAYEMDIDNGDMAEEHAKYVISLFLEKEIEEDMTLQQAFDQMFDEYLKGASGGIDYQLKSFVLSEMENYVDHLQKEIKKLKLIDLDSEVDHTEFD